MDVVGDGEKAVSRSACGCKEKAGQVRGTVESGLGVTVEFRRLLESWRPRARGGGRGNGVNAGHK